MSKPHQIVCEVCHERPATQHVCNGGTGKSSEFCEECFRSSAPPEISQLAAEFLAARCQYCGSQPIMGGTDFLGLITGVQKMKFMCLPCSMEHNRFAQQQLQPDSSGLSQQAQLDLLRKLDREADEHMKRWVGGGG